MPPPDELLDLHEVEGERRYHQDPEQERIRPMSEALHPIEAEETTLAKASAALERGASH